MSMSGIEVVVHGQAELHPPAVKKPTRRAQAEADDDRGLLLNCLRQAVRGGSWILTI